MSEKDRKDELSNAKTYIALAGAMVALGSSTIGYMLLGLIGGFALVITIFGFMWYLQTQLKTSIESIEVRIQGP